MHLLGLPSFVGRLEQLGGPLWRRLAPLARGLAHALGPPMVRRTAGAVVLALGLWITEGIARPVGNGAAPSHACCPRR